ncbi:MAG: response regulator [Acidobacteriota bacterium]
MKRVALIEDNPDNRLLVGALLEEHYDIREFEDGVSALAELPRQPPDAILLDISLPGMDGIEVLRRLRADSTLAAVPVIALTAHAMSGDRERFLAAGFDDYLSKPILDETDLIEVIERSTTT